MMTEEAKKILHNQIVEMNEYNSDKKVTIPSFEEFSSLKDSEILKYVFNYKNKNTFEAHGKKLQPYIELPSMDLSGEDLHDLYLSDFTPKVTNYGTSNINLENTNCVINLSSVTPMICEVDKINRMTVLIDLEQCNFNGCRLFGRLPQKESSMKEKFEVKVGEQTYTEEYTKRIERWNKQTEEKKISAKRIYERITQQQGKSLKGSKKTVPCSLSDYDLSGVDFNQKSEKGDTYREYFKENGIKYSFTGLYLSKLGNESLGVEEGDYRTVIFRTAKLACKAGDISIAEKYFRGFNEEEKNEILDTAYINGHVDFVEKNFNVYKGKYLLEVLKSAYKKEDIEFVNKNFYKLSSSDKKRVIEEACKKKDFDFVEKYFMGFVEKDKGEIISEVCKNGGEHFLEVHFDEICKNHMHVILENWKEIFKCKCIKLLPKMEEISAGQIENTDKTGKSNNGVLLYRSVEEKANIEVIKELMRVTILEQSKNPTILGTDGNAVELEGINYRKYSNKEDQSYEYKPILYLALSLPKGEYADSVINLLLDNGAKAGNTYIRVDSTGEIIQPCLNANKGRLREYLAKRVNAKSQPSTNGEIDETKQDFTIRKSKEQREDEIKGFFEKKVGFNKEQLSELVSNEHIWKNLSQASIEDDLELKKAIFDKYDVTTYVCKEIPHLWEEDPRLLYARMKFFEETKTDENNRNSSSSNMKKTLGANRKLFTDKYGEEILDGKRGDQEAVKEALLKKYPIPENVKNIVKELQEQCKETVISK